MPATMCFFLTGGIEYSVKGCQQPSHHHLRLLLSVHAYLRPHQTVLSHAIRWRPVANRATCRSLFRNDLSDLWRSRATLLFPMRQVCWARVHAATADRPANVLKQ